MPIFANILIEAPTFDEEMVAAFYQLAHENYNDFLNSCGDTILRETRSGLLKVIKTSDPRFEPGGGGIRGTDTILVSSRSSMLQMALTICHERVHLSDINSLIDMGPNWVDFVDEGRLSIDRLNFGLGDPEPSDPHKAFLFSAFLFCTEYRAYRYAEPDFNQVHPNKMARAIQNLYLLKIGVIFTANDLASLREACENSKSLEEYMRELNRSNLRENFELGYTVPEPRLNIQSENLSSKKTTSAISTK